jgi:hypothetical protein
MTEAALQKGCSNSSKGLGSSSCIIDIARMEGKRSLQRILELMCITQFACIVQHAVVLLATQHVWKLGCFHVCSESK